MARKKSSGNQTGGQSKSNNNRSRSTSGGGGSTGSNAGSSSGGSSAADGITDALREAGRRAAELLRRHIAVSQAVRPSFDKVRALAHRPEHFADETDVTASALPTADAAEERPGWAAKFRAMMHKRKARGG